MKNLILAIFAMSATFVAQAQAQNEIKAPLWQCALTFQARGGGVQAILGVYKMKGTGHIRCIDIAGNTQVIPVKVTLATKPISLNVAVGAFAFAGASTGIGVATRPEALLGNYYSLNSTSAFILGYGTNLALHGGAEALNINLGLHVVSGLGFQYGINKVQIEALN